MFLSSKLSFEDLRRRAALLAVVERTSYERALIRLAVECPELWSEPEAKLRRRLELVTTEKEKDKK